MPKSRKPPLPAAVTPDARDLAAILARAVLTTPATVLISDADGAILYVNRTFTALTGYRPAEAVGRKASLLKSGLMPAALYRRLWQRLRKGEDWTGEFHNRKKDGTCYWERATISPIRDASGQVSHYLKIAEDITADKRREEERLAREAELRAANRELARSARALRQSEERLRRLAREDALTGLLNRRGFGMELERVQALAVRQGQPVGVLVIDIDHFKLLNDRHGHAAGDRVLQALAALLRASLRASDLLCRYGGDELVAALPAASDATTRQAAERLVSAVRRRLFACGRSRIAVTVSVGAACGIPSRARPLEHLLKRADRALYRVKRDGRDGCAFDAADAADAPEAPAPGRPAFGPLLAALEARDAPTAAHCRRVARMARLLAEALRLPPDETARLEQAALLHDVGKIAVPDAILRKPGPLDAAERAAVQAHAQAGHAILAACPDARDLADLALSHHERLDGSGYPRGLKGRRLGLPARILAAADAYDAMRAGRAYAPPRAPAAALRELRRGSGTLFDPRVVRALARVQGALERVLEDAP